MRLVMSQVWIMSDEGHTMGLMLSANLVHISDLVQI